MLRPRGTVGRVGARSVALTLALLLRSASAHAEEGLTDGVDPGERGAVTSVGTLILTSVVGGVLMGRATTTFARNAGVDIAGFGFAAAPLAGHLVNGEYARAAAFTAAPLVMAGADVGLMQTAPDVLDEQGSPRTRVPFAIFFTVGLTSGVAGVVDTFFATSRREGRRQTSGLTDLHVWPLVGRDSGALCVGGTW